MNLGIPCLTVFIGSFLLFFMQPMLGRTLLPSFGGTATVWTICLAAYQILLLAGYFYAHTISRCYFKKQRFVHIGLLLLAMIWTIVISATLPSVRNFLGRSETPAFEVLFCVLVATGFPYVLLAAGATLVQSWLVIDYSMTVGIDSDGLLGGRPSDVYKLYAVSNLGSFTGLFIYPFLVEPHVSITIQWWGLAFGILLYLGLITVLANRIKINANGTQQIHPTTGDMLVNFPKHYTVALWFVVPAISVFTLNAVTAHLTLDVMPLPLLWVALLGLFLLSYVVGFSTRAGKILPLLLALTVASVFSVAVLHRKINMQGGFVYNLIACLSFCFFGATFLHAWLFTLRPNTRHLTLFYLGNAAGGALGGLLASLVAPAIFDSVFEFPCALCFVLIMCVLFCWRCSERWTRLGAVVFIGAVFCLVCVSWRPRMGDRPVIWLERGFYGTLKVIETKAKASQSEGVIHEFVHGNTVHGIQVLLPGKERMPTTYFTSKSGGYSVLAHPKYRSGEPMRVTILGLGIGVMLCYARTNDYYRCYEISPEVISLACNPDLFTFVNGCSATVDLIMMDARKGLESELQAGVEPYDVILIDAFTGDNLPYHLSTREAFDLYFKMLKPDGILAINISNWHLELEPFIKAVGNFFQCPVLGVASVDDFSKLEFASKFAFFCRTPENLLSPPTGGKLIDFRRQPDISMPTDEKGSFINAIKWN